MKGPSRINIEINKQIMRDGVRALCTLIETRVGEFNHVNVATAFRKLLPLQDRRDGASRGEVEQANGEQFLNTADPNGVPWRRPATGLTSRAVKDICL